MRCAVIDLATSIVVNVIIADPDKDVPPDGCILVWVPPYTPCSPGYYYDAANNTFIGPPEAIEEEPAPTLDGEAGVIEETPPPEGDPGIAEEASAPPVAEGEAV